MRRRIAIEMIEAIAMWAIVQGVTAMIVIILFDLGGHAHAQAVLPAYRGLIVVLKSGGTGAASALDSLNSANLGESAYPALTGAFLSDPDALNPILLMQCNATLTGDLCKQQIQEYFGQDVVSMEDDEDLSFRDVVVPHEPGIGRGPNIINAASPVSWALNRIDGKLDDKFVRSPYDGTGVDIYIVDTGTYAGHNEFGGRVTKGTRFLVGEPGSIDGNTDCNGHGTHVASLAAGKTFGVATGARIIPIRVFPCSGQGRVSSAIQAVYYATKDKTGRRKVINMSLTGPSSTAFRVAIAEANAMGIPVVVAAGNHRQDACRYSPAQSYHAITVASSTAGDYPSFFTNYGSCVNIFAPGSNVQGAYIGSPDRSAFLSGTSMASPLVAGVVATILQEYPWATTQEVRAILELWGQKGVMNNVPSTSPTPNLFLVNNGGETPFPTRLPTGQPTAPTSATPFPSTSPTPPTPSPTNVPSRSPTLSPTPFPTRQPTPLPTKQPSASPTPFPTRPTQMPTVSPTECCACSA